MTYQRREMKAMWPSKANEGINQNWRYVKLICQRRVISGYAAIGE